MKSSVTKISTNFEKKDNFKSLVVDRNIFKIEKKTITQTKSKNKSIYMKTLQDLNYLFLDNGFSILYCSVFYIGLYLRFERNSTPGLLNLAYPFDFKVYLDLLNKFYTKSKNRTKP